MRVIVDTSKCQGHAQCYAIAPDVFELDAEGFVIPNDEHEIAALQMGDVKLAVSACPEGALQILE